MRIMSIPPLPNRSARTCSCETAQMSKTDDSDSMGMINDDDTGMINYDGMGLINDYDIMSYCQMKMLRDYYDEGSYHAGNITLRRFRFSYKITR